MHDPRQNHLLAALAEDEFEHLHPDLELIRMPAGEVLHDAYAQLHHVYFPTTAILSLIYGMEDGSSAEIIDVGNEGMLGVALYMGGNTMPNRSMVLFSGYAYRLASQPLNNALARTGRCHENALNYVILRYIQARMTQIAQIAACNRHHSIEQRLCRWLLFTLDRLSDNELTVTQESIARSLGVRREGITDAAGKLQREGLIHCRRGHIIVLDRSGLENWSCECYHVVKAEFDRLFPDVTANHTDGPCRIRPYRSVAWP